MEAINLFAKNFIRINYEDLPQDVVNVTKKEVLDLLGVALAGYASPGVKELADLINEWGGKEESSVIYSKKKVPAPMAARVAGGAPPPLSSLTITTANGATRWATTAGCSKSSASRDFKPGFPG